MKNNGIKIGLWNGIQLRENSMKLLAVYTYKEQPIYEFIYKSLYNNYFGYYRNVLSKAQTSTITATYNRVVKKTYDFT